MTRRRIWWWIGGIGLVLAAAWATFGRPDVIDADGALVTNGPLRVTVDEAGTTRVVGHADVNAPTAGRWVPSTLRAGDPVRAGQSLGTLFPAPLDASAQQQARERLGAAEAAQREAETRVAAARTALDEAQRTRARAERMLDAGGLAPQEAEHARTMVSERQSELDGAVLRARAAAHEVEATRAVIAPFSGQRGGLAITAPVSGTVLRVFEEHERVVAPGTPLLEVGDPRDLEAIIPLLTSDAARVRDGAAVLMTFGTPASGAGDTVQGHVLRVEPAAYAKLSALGVEEQRVNVIATAPATSVHVGDQYRVHARVVVWDTANTVRVPVGALLRDGTQWFTYVVAKGRATRRSVQIGERSERFAQVRDGLTTADTVLLYPGQAVRDGVRVRLTIR